MTASSRSLVKAATAELLVSGNVDAVGRFFTEDYTAHVTEQDMRGGHDLLRAVVEIYRKAFSDLSAEVVVFLECDDTVAWRRTMRAKQTGPFKGFPGTGLPIVWQEMVISRIAGSRIAEEWIVTDLAERLLLGRKSSPPKPSTTTTPMHRRGKA
jgi:predicted ester cyclase